MKIVQVKLAYRKEILTTWVDKRPGLAVGSYITLKDLKPSQKWLVSEIYEGEHEASDFDWHRKWDNNI